MTYLLSLFFLFPNDTCKERYYSEVFNLKSEREYYFIVKAKKNERVFNAIVSNVDFIKDLKYKNEVLDATLISKIVNDKYVLALNDSSHWFSEVKYNRKVSKSEKQGEKNFVNRYFDNNGYLKDDVPMDYLGQIFETLIKWNYLINSTEGGLFYIMKSRYCN